MQELSDKQRRILDFIHNFLDEKGYPPTVRDIQRACQISSTSVVDYNLNILERAAYIRRDADVSRGIELLGTRVRNATVSVPLVGVIAAGEPIPVPSAETWRGAEALESLELSERLIGNRQRVFALKVKGTSMIDAFINDGDIVLIQSATQVDNGEMVVAWLKDEREVTLKRLYQEGSIVRLQPANSEMQPIYTRTDNLEIQGKVVGVVRVL